ncbi:MAG: hypothetical protein IPH18_14265 [Chitinophagaceae bacterium]|nr:hypothetical protein [Chitinophagaceae bacterium]
MKLSVFFLFLFIALRVSSQEYTDTIFTVRDNICSCKYSKQDGDDNKIFDRSEQPARYPGGEEEWNKFLKKNLYSDFTGKKHEFTVHFMVNKNGMLSDFRLLDRTVVQKFDEAVRVLKLSGPWFPAIQHGYCVKAYYRQTFRF